MNATLTLFSDTAALHEHLLKDFQARAQQAIQAKGRFNVAVSGGNSPAFFFRSISGLRFSQWSQVSFFWVDERWVDYSSEQSNYGNAIRQGLGLVAASCYPVPTNLASPADAALSYSALIRSQVPDARFDWVLLGMGSDGHTASLFTERDLTHQEDVVITTHPVTGQTRVSLSFPSLLRADSCTLLVTGTDKQSVLQALINGNAPISPVKNLLEKHTRITVVTDIPVEL